MAKTLVEKIWDAHVVQRKAGYPDLLYIDTHLIHEVTSPQAFNGLRQRGLPVYRPKQIVATVDHNVPTLNQDKPIADKLSREQVQALERNCGEFGVELWGLGHPNQGIVHVIGPELGITQPGKTIVCGDSHTSTHGALGAIAFGIGTSQVEQVMATQCLLQQPPATMRINIEGELERGVTPKDLILHIISVLGTDGGTGYFIEYAGSTIRDMGMEGRMTVCNMSIEMGARGGLIAPDDVTFTYLEGRPYAPAGQEWQRARAYWQTLFSDQEAVFDREIAVNAADVAPMVTYGTNPGMGIAIDKKVPGVMVGSEDEAAGFEKALNYMGFTSGEAIEGRKVDYVFIGSCTNGRIEDLRLFAGFVKGKQKHPDVEVWAVPGSKHVERQAIAEGLDKVLADAGILLREPGCSACLGMNEDKIPAGKFCLSTSNRNFEGRQGPDARTSLVSPITAAAAAVYGEIVDVRKLV